jgi:hypothetical protein
MKTIQFSDGTNVPALGQGTWKFGEGERDAAEEVAALRAGVELGMTLIDTGEMYGYSWSCLKNAENAKTKTDDISSLITHSSKVLPIMVPFSPHQNRFLDQELHLGSLIPCILRHSLLCGFYRASYSLPRATLNQHRPLLQSRR